jgi:hypothetical protein
VKGVVEIPTRAYSKGARKALSAMRKRYGKKKGTSIFYAKANKFGKRGKSNAKKANSTYSKGSRLRRRRKGKK